MKSGCRSRVVCNVDEDEPQDIAESSDQEVETLLAFSDGAASKSFGSAESGDFSSLCRFEDVNR